MVKGQDISYKKHCTLAFGSYAQVHEQHDNDMATRTTGAIALGPTGNTQGSHSFFSLTTGRRLNKSHKTKLPMPAEVIARVHEMASQNIRAKKSLKFYDKTGL